MTLAQSGQSLHHSVTHRYCCSNLASKAFTDSSKSSLSSTVYCDLDRGGARAQFAHAQSARVSGI